jgi:hypothetical protein
MELLSRTLSFRKRKYVIPTGRNVKRSFIKDEIKEIFHYVTDAAINMKRAKDFWMFSYLCNGINMMDIARLKWKNLDSLTITFIREKTKRTSKGNPITITAARNEYINRIIDF